MNPKNLALWLIILFLFPNSYLQAQFDFPLLSAKSTIYQQVGNAQIVIEYERPSARSRKIFGGLVPWNQVWRTGAGPCTKLSLSETVQIGKQWIPAGTYSLFSIPKPDEWMIILNTDTSLYGSYDYDKNKDVARFRVPVSTSSRYYETFTIDIDIIPNNARIYISWEHISLHFDLKTTSDQQVMDYISNELMQDKVKDSHEYAMAADYLIYQGGNLSDALLLAEKSLSLAEQGFAHRLKTETLEKLMRYPEALEAAKAGLAYQKIRPLENEAWRQQGIDEWEKFIEKININIGQ